MSLNAGISMGRKHMRRSALVAATLMVAATFVTTASASASAAPAARNTRATAVLAKTKAPAKVKAGSVWTMQPTGGICQSDTFATHHAFASTISDGTGDAGTYKGSKKLTMTWTAGTATGAIFQGTWTRNIGEYIGHYGSGGQSMAAVLAPVADGGCPGSRTTPAMTTAPSESSVDVGEPNTDTATVTGSGGVTPTGSVTFYVCAGDSAPCTTAAAVGGTDLGSALLSGSGDTATATSPAFSPSSPGGYCFLGVYSGDTNYDSTSDGSTTDECFTVTSGSSELTTVPSSPEPSTGTPETDTATVTGDGGVTPTGDVTFYVCGPDQSVTACTDANDSEVGSPVPLTGSGDVATATSANFVPNEPGFYCFLAVYPGDGHYAPASDGSTTSECFYALLNVP
jgi:hypothetical protein